jgi:DNA-binding HxlR family transcriptional regulator
MKKEHHDCPADAAVNVLSGKWKMLILWQLVEKSRRFGELKRSVSGITEKMLIQQLRELEDIVLSTPVADKRIQKQS